MVQPFCLLESGVTGLPSPVHGTISEVGEPELLFGDDVTVGERDVRTASDLTYVLREPNPAQGSKCLYVVYRNVASGALSSEIERRGLSYGITVLNAGTIPGTQEWTRTRGHTNSDAPGTNLPYPEVHEVLHGEAWLYLQNGTGDRVSDTVVIPLMAGNKIVVAPGWASLLVNTGSEPLVIGTWRMADCITEGAALLERGGMAHFVLRGPDGKPFCEANEQYNTVPLPREACPKELPDWGLSTGEPLLAAFHRSPDSLRFLLRPQDFDTNWKVLYD